MAKMTETGKVEALGPFQPAAILGKRPWFRFGTRVTTLSSQNPGILKADVEGFLQRGTLFLATASQGSDGMEPLSQYTSGSKLSL